METLTPLTINLHDFLQARSKPELIAFIEKMTTPAWTLMFQNMTLTRTEMLEKLEEMVGLPNHLFAQVDNDTDIDEMDHNLTLIFQEFPGGWSLVQKELEDLIGQTLHRLSLALFDGHLGDYVRNQSF